jgi:hypothetical protein
MKKEEKKESKYTLGLFIWIICGVFAAWLVYAFLLYKLSGDWSHRGAFGDMFGAINALFSGLAFAGIIFTILLQREELKLQREELKLTRTELTRTASAQEASQKELSKQAETLQITAQINAINTLIGVYQERLKARQSTPESREQLSLNIERLELRLLESLDKENPA